jgi:uncharacterized protein YoxC
VTVADSFEAFRTAAHAAIDVMIRDLKDKMAQTAVNVQNMSALEKDLIGRVSELNGKVAVASIALSEANGKLAAAKSDSAAFAKQAKDKADDIVREGTARSTAASKEIVDKAHDEAKNIVERATKNVDGLRGTRDALQAEITKLTSEIKQKRGELDQMKKVVSRMSESMSVI